MALTPLLREREKIKYNGLGESTDWSLVYYWKDRIFIYGSMPEGGKWKGSLS